MFEIGEHIVYGINGICRVESIGPSPYDKNDTRTFYLLIPVNNPMCSTIYTPVDNERVPMRRLMTREEIEKLILALPEIETLAVPMESSAAKSIVQPSTPLTPRVMSRLSKPSTAAAPS